MRGIGGILAVVVGAVVMAGVCGGQTTTVPAGDEAAAASRTRAQEVRHLKVAALIADARKLYAAGQYKEAADLLRQATIIDPQDENAALMLRTVDEERQGIQRGGPVVIAGDKLMHPMDVHSNVTFTTNDLQLVSDAPIRPSGADQAVSDKLQENLKELIAEGQPLDKILMFLRDNLGMPILVNWAALHEAGVEKTTLVTLSLKDVPFRKALTTVLSLAGGEKASLTYTISEGSIIISTRADLMSAAYQVDKTYDIRDMIGPSAEVRDGVMPPVIAAELAKQRAEAVANLIDTIRKSVAPDSWKDAGGSVGTMREEKGLLIIHQTVDNQLAVWNLLQQLRETRSVLIAMETRIVLVPDGILDDFRIGWTADGKVVVPAPASTGPAPGVPGAIVLGKSVEGLHVGIIDNWTLNLLLAATQTSERTVSIVAPRLDVRNGGEATLNGAMPVKYVRGFPARPVPIEADPYAPDEALTDTGFKLTVRPTVSADRRFMVLELKFDARVLTGVEQVAAGGAAGERKIDKPVIKTMTGEYTLAIPDGGTVLMDGGEVPSFPNDKSAVNAVKDKRHMLILMRPNIIIHREIENDLFGPGSDRPTGLPWNGAGTRPATRP